MTQRSSVRVAVNGFGLIGERVADAIYLQDGPELIGVAMSRARRPVPLEQKGIALYAESDETLRMMTEVSLTSPAPSCIPRGSLKVARNDC
jgi:glyceraldehyde-3-phosphate dehydrogenase (NAD(P))